MSEELIIDDAFGANQILKDMAPHTHYIDIRIRLNGEYYWFEGDFLKHVLPHVTFKRLDHEITATLEGHKETTPIDG